MANNQRTPEEETALTDSLSLLEKVKTIPAYKAGAKGVELYGKAHPYLPTRDMASNVLDVLNQMLFDIGANTYNSKAVPMNIVGGFFGYNPGFSGERFMESLPWEKGISSFGERPEARSDPDYPWGLPAPEGGETSWSPQQQPQISEPALATAPAEEAVTPSYLAGEIKPEIQVIFDKILRSNKETKLAYFNAMPINQKTALLEYQKSVVLLQEKENMAKTIESPYETETEQREAEFDFNVTEYTQNILDQYYSGKK